MFVIGISCFSRCPSPRSDGSPEDHSGSSWSEYINPHVLGIINNFSSIFIPYALTFLVFSFTFIPEVDVHTGIAALSAAVAALLGRLQEIFVISWPTSAVGIVPSKLLGR